MTIYYRVRGWNEAYETTETRKLKKLKWVAIPNKQDGDGYTQLLDHEKGPAHFGCWTAILQLASKCELRGSLLRKLGESWSAHDTDSISRITRMPKSLVMVTIRRCLDIGWLEELAAFPAASAANPSDAAEKPVLKGREGKGIEGKGMEGEGTDEAPAPSDSTIPLSLPPPAPLSDIDAALLATFQKPGAKIIDVLRYYKVNLELNGEALEGEWREETSGQNAPEVALIFILNKGKPLNLPSKYRKARRTFEDDGHRESA